MVTTTVDLASTAAPKHRAHRLKSSSCRAVPRGLPHLVPLCDPARPACAEPAGIHRRWGGPGWDQAFAALWAAIAEKYGLPLYQYNQI